MSEAATTPKKPRAKKAAPAAVAVVETFAAYKGFNADLACNPTGTPFQYEVGKTYVHSGTVRQCSSGFHACQNPLDVLDYYGLGDGNRFARVTLGGKVDRSDDKKWAAAEITVVAEIKLPDLIADAIKFIKGLCATDGDKVQSASGHYSKLAASGYYSQLAASGNSSKLAASGYYSQLAASGHYSKLAASGDSSKLAASGDSSKLAASGDSSKLAASGDYSQLAASGHYSKLAASGYYSQLEITGAKSAAAAVGPGSSIKAIDGTPIAICEYRDGVPIGFATGIVGKDGIEAGKWYVARGGKLVLA